jgi:hypothetical protein
MLRQENNMSSSFAELSDTDIDQLKSSFGSAKIDISTAGMALMAAYGVGYNQFPSGSKRQRRLREKRNRLLNGEAIQKSARLKRVVEKVFAASDPSVDGPTPTAAELEAFLTIFSQQAGQQLRDKRIAVTKEANTPGKEQNQEILAQSIELGKLTQVGSPGTRRRPAPSPRTPGADTTLDLDGASPVTGDLFGSPAAFVVEEPTFDAPAAAPDELDSTPDTVATHDGNLVVEKLQTSMEKSSDLVSKAADAVDASAKATTDLQKTVQDTTAAVNALVTAQKKTESASPALSQQVLAQIQADPAIAKLVSDGLLKWDDLLGKNPGPGQPGHVSGVEPGDPVVLPDKLQKVINNLQTAQTREAASLKGAIEANQAARTTTGFRQSTAGYYPQAQVWMPIRAPPASLPGRR